MDFVDRIKELADNIPNKLSRILTEEATKNALVLPFISALGYNVFDIHEVIPEFDANVGASKKYKLDYAILKEGKPIILIECKHHADKLDKDSWSQLFHYFAATEARIGILTNGIIYRFYSDLEEKNKLDEKPFLEINFLELQETLINELKKLTKLAFNLDDILIVASELKYTREIKRILAEQLNEPTDDFVKFFATKVYSGRVTEKVKQEFTGFVQRAFKQFIREQISELLLSASNLAEGISNTKDENLEQSTVESNEKNTKPNSIVTTAEELEGFYIVKAILSQNIEPKRIAHRDTVNYFNILLDDNKLKPLCRLYFNNPNKKYLGLFDYGESGKIEEKISISHAHDLYQYSDRLKATLARYDGLTLKAS
jgi:predicted type IV restriction endonuclease